MRLKFDRMWESDNSRRCAGYVLLLVHAGDLVLAWKYQRQQGGHERCEVLGNGAVPGALPARRGGRGLPRGRGAVRGWSRLLGK